MAVGPKSAFCIRRQNHEKASTVPGGGVRQHSDVEQIGLELSLESTQLHRWFLYSSSKTVARMVPRQRSSAGRLWFRLLEHSSLGPSRLT